GGAGQAAAALALGLLKDSGAVTPLAALARTGDGAPQCEAVTALAKIGGDEGARAVANLLAVKTAPGAGTSAVQRVALVEAWRLGTGAPVAQLTDFARDPDPAARAHAVYSLARLGIARAVPALLGALVDREPYVRAAAQLRARLASARFALRRQAAIALAQADSAAGVAAAAELARDRDWRWRGVAAEAFGAARDRARLEVQLADSDGRVVAQALQALGRVVAESDTSLGPRARGLLGHPDAAVRSVTADLLARHPTAADVDTLAAAYER